MSYLPDATKEKLAEALKDVKKTASRWEKCLLVQIEGFGRFDQSACDNAEENFFDAVEAVRSITDGRVDITPLLATGDD